MPGFGASKRCTHILVTGHRCGSPALRGQYLCYFHARLMGRVTGRIDGADCMTHFDNEESIQFALMSLLSRTLVGKIDLPRANFALKVLNLAVRNSRRARFFFRTEEMVRNVPDYADQYFGEHPEHADPARVAARKAAAAKGVATRRAHEQAREAKRQERAARLAARRAQCAPDTVVPEDSTGPLPPNSQQTLPAQEPSTSMPKSCAPPAAQEPSTEMSKPCSSPMPDPHPGRIKPASNGSTSSGDSRNAPRTNRQTNTKNELREFQIALDGAARGSLDDLQTALEAAGWYDPKTRKQ